MLLILQFSIFSLDLQTLYICGDVNLVIKSSAKLLGYLFSVGKFFCILGFYMYQVLGNECYNWNWKKSANQAIWLREIEIWLSKIKIQLNKPNFDQVKV